MIKNYDFDRVMLFVDLEWLKSIDFTGVLSDWWDINRLVLMSYFFIKYGVSVEFDRSFIFQGFEGILGVRVVIFGDVKSGEMLDFVGFCRSGYRSGYLDDFWLNTSEMPILQGVCG